MFVPTLRSLLFALSASGLLAILGASACSPKLPEPESRAARLYVTYCSGKGCHDPIPPRRGGREYWNDQTRRMLELMRQHGRPLPTPEEQAQIDAYLRRHAQGGE